MIINKQLSLLMIFGLSSFISQLQAAEPIPVECIKVNSKDSGSEYWSNVRLSLSNSDCHQPLNMQDAIVTFDTKGDLNNTSFWGSFDPLQFPDNPVIHSVKTGDVFKNSLTLHISADWDPNKKILPEGSSITLEFGGKDAQIIDGSVKIYLPNFKPSIVGGLKITNDNAKPEDVVQTYALAHLKFNDQVIKDIQIPWNNSAEINELSPGNYRILVDPISNKSGTVIYQGGVDKSQVAIEGNKKEQVAVKFTQTKNIGSIEIKLDNLPAQLAGYDQTPLVSLISEFSQEQKNLSWGKTNQIENLSKGRRYTLSMPVIDFKGVTCNAVVSPNQLVVQQSPQQVKASYSCGEISTVTEKFTVEGAPSDLKNLVVTLSSQGQTSVEKNISLIDGGGSLDVSLTEGRTYQIETVPTAQSVSANPFVAQANQEIKIGFSQNLVKTNMIGFFQSYDDPGVWVFNGPGETLASSGYNVLIDAFWVNYPYCWGDGSGKPGQGNPIPDCKGISNQPGPGTKNTIDNNFWTNFDKVPSSAPNSAGDAYTAYWTSLHTSGPYTMYRLRQAIADSGKPIKLLASIGGWNMGGSAGGQPLLPLLPKKPAWAALLADPDVFANDMTAIVNIKANGKQLYDGIDIDIETLYGEGCKDQSSCTDDDKKLAIDHMVDALAKFKKDNPQALLSISPRATDIACQKNSCSYSNGNGYGFVGEILRELADKGVYFDYINPQFYNDDAARNIPTGYDAQGNPVIGHEVVGILKLIKELNIIGPNTTFNIGVLAQTTEKQVDTGGASIEGNPGVPQDKVQALWTLLTDDPGIKDTGIKINGLMIWAANLAFDGNLGGNVRSTQSRNVVPFNWGAAIVNKQ